MPGLAARLHPATALALAAWGPAAALAGDPLPPLAYGALLAAASGRGRLLAALYAWMAAGMLAAGLAVAPLGDAVEATLRGLAVAVPASAAAALVPASWAAYAAYRLGLPPLAAYSLAIALRLADYYSASVRDVAAALRGRGVSGRLALAYRAPVPLVVHMFQATGQLAEALVVKGPSKSKSWAEKPGLGPLDYATLAALAVWAYRLLWQVNPDLSAVI